MEIIILSKLRKTKSRDEVIGLDILSKLPRDIRNEVIEFHKGQWIAENIQKWEWKHRSKYRNTVSNIYPASVYWNYWKFHHTECVCTPVCQCTKVFIRCQCGKSRALMMKHDLCAPPVLKRQKLH
jgi:hypothetical protein